MRRTWPLVLAIMILVFGSILSVQAEAVAQVVPPTGSGTSQQKSVKLPDDLTREEVRQLLSRLSDEEVRQLLIQQLDKVADQEEAKTEATAMLSTLEDELPALKNRIDLMFSAVGDLPSVGTFLIDTITNGQPSRIWKILLATVVIFAGGFAGEWLFRRLFSGGIQHPRSESASLIDKICILGLRLIVDLLGIAVFALCALGLFFVFYQGHEPVRQSVATVYWSIILIRVVAATARFAIAPRVPALRLPPIGNEVAVTLYRRLIWISAALILAVLVLDLFDELGMEEGLTLLFGRFVSFGVIAFVIAIIWHDRQAIAGLIQSDSNADAEPSSPVKRLLASNWHILAICYVGGTWVFGTVQTLLTGERAPGPAVISVVVLIAIPFVDWMMQAGLKRLLRAPEELPEEPASVTSEDGDAASVSEAQPERNPTENEYFPVLLRNFRIILALVTVIILAKIWDIDLRGAAAMGVGERVAAAIFDIIVTLVLASAIWGIVKTAIGQKIGPTATEAEAAEGGDPGGAGGTRLQTLLPLFQKFLFITILVIVVLIVLSELGVDIGPLIAGAGIVGIAIGFGAQTLVRDIVSGVFFLIEDAFRVGEYIDIGGGIRGMVEDISIRSFRLRHHNGPIHTVPFGGVKTLTNFSRDWVIMKLEMRLPFDTDIEQVRKIVKKVGVELMNDPAHGSNFLQPLKSQGVNRMDDSAFIFRMKFMAKPGEQFLLRREVYRRVQEALAAHDIHFAPKRVIVDTTGMSPEQAEAATAAAAADAAEDRATQGGKAGAL